MNTDALKILFMHGLESGPKGSKARYLQQNFQNVCIPNMQMSLFDIRKSNSVLRNILSCPIFFIWLTAAIIGLILALLTCKLLALLIWSITFSGILFVIRKCLIQQGLSASLERCIKIQADAIHNFQPDIIVGSSWGAFLALMCTSRGLYSGPQLLIAPPIKLVFDKLGNLDNRWKDLCKSISLETAKQILLIHGNKDRTVSVSDSQLFAQTIGSELKIFPGDHSLNEMLLDTGQNKFKELIDEFATQNKICG